MVSSSVQRKEFSYQEMAASLRLPCSHPSPCQVLTIACGDGGALQAVVKRSSGESVVRCEIDEDVIQVSKKFLLGLAMGSSSAKLTLYMGDGFEFMEQNQGAVSVILTDSSDPIGPAESLFKESYYLDLIEEMRQFCRSLFPVVAYAYCTVPTFPSGQAGFMLGSKNLSTNFWKAVQQLTQKQVEQMQLKYYNCDVHQAAFVLPECAAETQDDVS